MEVITLNSSYYIGLSSEYTPDETVTFNQDTYHMEQGMSFPLAKAFQYTNDTTTNNYSNLFLTKNTPLTGILDIVDLNPVDENVFTTYLAMLAKDGITDASRFMVIQNADPAVDTAQVSISGTRGLINSNYMFTINLISDTLCKIKHNNVSTTRYLTVSYNGNFFFTTDTGEDYLQDKSSQIFYYTYDRNGDYITLYKNIGDVAYFVTYTPGSTGSGLSLNAAVSGTPDVQYTNYTIFKCYSRQDTSNIARLYDPWVAYTRGTDTNTLTIDPVKSVQAPNSNLLLNSEYLTLANDTSLKLNALSLKNTNTPENFQSRNNPFYENKSIFFHENSVQSREYKKLFTGSNQALGDDNITLGYESYTTDIVLRKDSITYFHVPNNIYPFKQLNINDSGLVQAGAIAGDHPIKSDKIFKKLAIAKDTSPFGVTSEEATGAFLCSWLSGGSDLTLSPVWVDRYYIPSKITAAAALTSRPIHAITYTTVFESLCREIPVIPMTGEVFDKPSDLIFEPGTYYAYHHYGPSDVSKYIDTFNTFLVDKGLPYYYDLTSNVLTLTSVNNDYAFYGNNYAITSPLTGIQESNQFTMSFDMYNSDWTKPFGYQIIGNLLNDGFGIFNENVVTPTIFVNAPLSLNILNTDFKQIKKIDYTQKPLIFIRSRFGENYSVIFADGSVSQYTCDDFLVSTDTSNVKLLSAAVEYINIDSTAFVLCSGVQAGGYNKVIQINLQTNTSTSIDSSSLAVSAVFVPSAGSAGFNTASTIDYLNNKFYFTPGSFSRRINNDIYYLTDNRYTINAWYNIESSGTQVLTAFKSKDQIVDFNIDFDGNIWVVTCTEKYYKFTQQKELLLSGTLTSNTTITTTISLTGNGVDRSFTLSNSGSPIPGDYIVNNSSGVRLLPALDYTISGSTNNTIVFSTPPGNNIVYTVARTYIIDAFKSRGIDFTAEFANGKYIDQVLFVRTNYNTSLTPITGYQFATFTTNGQPLTSVFYPTLSAKLALTNSKYLRNYVLDTYPDSNLNIKAVTTNVYDPSDISVNEIIYNLSALDPGYHHFAIRFDSYHGYMTLFIDGSRLGEVQFQPRKYKFSNLVYRPFVVGSSCFNNSTPLFEYLQKNSYLIENTRIKNFCIYNTPLNDYDIIMHARRNQTIHDVHFNVPCGRRNYLEEIERYFKANVPGSKSTTYNIVLRNTGITNSNLQKQIEQYLLNTIKNSAPVYAKLNTIKWVN